MNKNEKLALLTQWRDTIENSDKAFKLLQDAVGSMDGPLSRSIHTMQAAYTRAIAMIFGDTENWLEWYACENGMGAKGLEAGHGESMKPRRNLNDLLELIDG